MDAEHTLGPWKFDGHQRIRAVNGPQDGSADIAHIYSSHRADGYAAGDTANGRLIAAAPDMLAALRAIADMKPEPVGDTGFGMLYRKCKQIARAGLACDGH